MAGPNSDRRDPDSDDHTAIIPHTPDSHPPPPYPASTDLPPPTTHPLSEYSLVSITVRLCRLPPPPPHTKGPPPPAPTFASLLISRSPPGSPPAPYTTLAPAPSGPHSRWCLFRHLCICSARPRAPAAADPRTSIFVTPVCAGGGVAQTYMIPLHAAHVHAGRPRWSLRRPRPARGAGAGGRAWWGRTADCGGGSACARGAFVAALLSGVNLVLMVALVGASVFSVGLGSALAWIICFLVVIFR